MVWLDNFKYHSGGLFAFIDQQVVYTKSVFYLSNYTAVISISWKSM